MTDDTHGRGPQLAAVTGTLGGLALLATVLRVYTRVHIVKSVGSDDYFAVAAELTHIWYTAVVLLGIHYGTGRHMSDLSADNAMEALRYWWMCYMSYCATMTLAKISIGLFFLRLMVQRVQRMIIWTVMTITAVTGIVFMLVTMLQCSPIPYFWNKVYPDAVGSCLAMEIIIALTYVYGGICTVCDITLAVLPVIVIWRLTSLDLRTKLLLVPILGMACVASAAAIVRMPYIMQFYDPDFLYGTIDIAIWSTTETGVAVTAASLATLRPLVTHCMGRCRWTCGSEDYSSDRRPSDETPVTAKEHQVQRKTSTFSSLWAPSIRSQPDKDEDADFEMCSPSGQTFLTSDIESGKSQPGTVECIDEKGGCSFKSNVTPKLENLESQPEDASKRRSRLSMNWPLK